MVLKVINDPACLRLHPLAGSRVYRCCAKGGPVHRLLDIFKNLNLSIISPGYFLLHTAYAYRCFKYDDKKPREDEEKGE